MRKSREEAARTRRHIVTTAASEFRRNGVEGIGLSDLMAKAGLTHGGFYRHFKDKDDLVAEALDFAFTTSAQTLTDSMAQIGFEKGVCDYLSEMHRDHRSEGCPFAALGAELARCQKSVRDNATVGFLRQVKAIAANLKELSPAEAQKRALVIMSSIAGALNMSRVVTDPALSQAILQETAKNMQFLASRPETDTPGEKQIAKRRRP